MTAILTRVYVASPRSEQAIAIARFFSKFPQIHLIGVLFDGEKTPGRYFRECMSLDDFQNGNLNADIIPTGIRSTEKLLAEGPIMVHGFVLGRAMLEVCNKQHVLEIAESVGVPIPLTWNSILDVPSSAYPVFFKEATEVGGGRRGILHAGVVLESYESLIFQEIIDSLGTYGVAFLAQNGEVIATTTHFERFSFPHTGGSAVLIERFEDDRLVEHTSRLIRKLNYSGWGLAEYKYSEACEDFVLMEINGKLWASLEFSLYNEPAFAMQIGAIDSTSNRSCDRAVFIHRLLGLGPVKLWRPMLASIGSRPVSNPRWGALLIHGWVPLYLRRLGRRFMGQVLRLRVRS